MKLLVLFLAAASALRFDVTDGRGKRLTGITIQAIEPDIDDWYELKIQKRKNEPILVWPFDGRAKAQDGDGAIPVIVLYPNDNRAPASARVTAALVAGQLLGKPHAITPDREAINSLKNAEDPFARGVGLLREGKAEAAAEFLGRALRERERQLTRVPSEIYAAAMLFGRALSEAGKFDEAALAYRKALQQRPSDPVALNLRAIALTKAGKPDAR